MGVRVHAKHLGHPLLGDEAYGGAGGSAVAAIGRGKAARCAAYNGSSRKGNKHNKTFPKGKKSP